MENIRKSYLLIVHFLCLGLLIFILGTDLFMANRSLIVYTLLAMHLGSGYLLFKKS
jgi:hypothetical protein